MTNKAPWRAMRDLPLHIKGLVVVTIPLVGLLAVIVAFYLVQRENQKAERWVSHTLEVRSEIQTVHVQLEEAEIGVLEHAITGTGDWLKPLRDAEQRLPQVLDRLRTMVSDNPAQLGRVRRIRSLVAERLRQLNSLGTRLAAEPGTAASQAMLAEGMRSLQRILREFRETLAEEDRLLAERRARARAVWDRGYAVIAAGILFAPAGAILAMLLFTEAIAGGIKRLDRNARLLAAGQPVSSMLSGNDEIGRLERSMGEAASLLSEREAQLRRSADELEQRVGERTAELAKSNEALEAEIGDRKRAEEQLADANERLRAVIDASPLAIIGLDLNGAITGWNPAAERMFGWSAEEVAGRTSPAIADESLLEFRELLAGAARGEVLTAVETRRRRKDGQMLDIRLWTAPLRSHAGEARGKIGIVADFTEQRRLEQQFTQAQKMEAVGRLAGGVAHDFNNVITVVSGYGHMLLEGVGDDPSLCEAAEEVLKAADRAAALASQLLAFSRRQVIQPKVVDVNGLVRNVERMLRRVIGEDVELKTVLRPTIGAVRADPGQIEQVLMNLAVNSRDAMPGGGKLTIETATAVLDDQYARTHAGVRAGHYVMLAVSDTGIGMDAETRNHLFEPFFTTKERGKGTGLGLSTVYGIVKQHGGDVWVYSEPGKGTTFKIYLPQIARAAVTTPEQSASPAPAGDETVLVVEDEPGVRRLIRDILELQGYRVIEADSGEQALSIGEEYQGRIHLLLTDIVMQGINGRDLAEALLMLRPETRVLFLSGYTDLVAVEHGVLEPSAQFLQKPFTPDTLAHKVREVLDHRAKV